MHQLGRADAEGQRAHAAVRGGVAVAADQGRAGQGQALLGTDDVDDALAVLAEVEQLDAVGAGRLAHRQDQRLAGRIGLLGAAGLGRHGVVGRAVDQARLRRRIALLDGFLQRLAARHVVQQQPVDMQQDEAVAEIGDDVAVPDLVEKRLAHWRSSAGADISTSQATPPASSASSSPVDFERSDTRAKVRARAPQPVGGMRAAAGAWECRATPRYAWRRCRRRRRSRRPRLVLGSRSTATVLTAARCRANQPMRRRRLGLRAECAGRRQRFERPAQQMRQAAQRRSRPRNRQRLVAPDRSGRRASPATLARALHHGIDRRAPASACRAPPRRSRCRPARDRPAGGRRAARPASAAARAS